MVLVGCDFHPAWQQVSWLDRGTGEAGDQKLVHEPGAVEKFYQQFPAGTRIGMEATGNCEWFVELVTRLGPGRRAIFFRDSERESWPRLGRIDGW